MGGKTLDQYSDQTNVAEKLQEGSKGRVNGGGNDGKGNGGVSGGRGYKIAMVERDVVGNSNGGRKGTGSVDNDGNAGKGNGDRGSDGNDNGRGNGDGELNKSGNGNNDEFVDTSETVQMPGNGIQMVVQGGCVNGKEEVGSTGIVQATGDGAEMRVQGRKLWSGKGADGKEYIGDNGGGGNTKIVKIIGNGADIGRFSGKDIKSDGTVGSTGTYVYWPDESAI